VHTLVISLTSSIKEHAVTAPRSTIYTYDKLSEAANASASYHGVLRYLGLPITGGGASHLARRMKQLGVDVSHFSSHRPPPEPLHPLARGEIANALTEARSLADLARRLGLPVTPRGRRHIIQQLAEHGLSAERLGYQRPVLDPAVLHALAPQCTSRAEMMRNLALDPANSADWRRLGRALSAHEVDTDHFVRNSWAAPRPRTTRASPDAVLQLNEGDRRISGKRLRRAMAAAGVPAICTGCGIDGWWYGRPLTLEVDHINGDFRDNRLENLRLLCPNCHAITDNYCRKQSTSGPN
jgi:5-methylcytosine-specific restriction endonuclease McrA